MTTELPTPPVPADVDLRDFAFTPMYRARLFGSAFHARATDAEWRAGVTLWLKCQDQSPAGSLPDDDIELCRLAELGRDLKTWKKVRAGALHGWLKCSDGRLYNPVMADQTTALWAKKQSFWGRFNRRVEMASGLWEKLRKQVFERDNYTCRYCSKRGVRLECDHVQPISKGGLSVLENLVTACLKCNRSKGAKLLTEWRGRRVAT